MDPENNSQARTYFIAGPPRVGKTTLAYRFAEIIQGHVVSTDAIRNAAKKVCVDKTGPLFKINHYNALDENEWLARHLHRPEVAIEDQNKESEAIWRSLVSFCNIFCEDNEKHIMEGVHLLPSLVSQMEYQPKHVVYVGNTSDEHVDSIIEYGRTNPEQCWLTRYGYSEERVRGIANFVKHQSIYFRAEAEKYGFSYFELGDTNFDESVQEVIAHLTD